jgi:GT2 family glycosyltransferase
MTNTPTTSIIIVAYNCEDLIHQNIASCVKEPNTEVILIDNASTDETLQQIDVFKDQIILISNKENKGFTAACNQGIQQAKGKYIFLLNPDAWVSEGCITTLVSKLNENPELGAIAPNLCYPDGSFQNYTRSFPTVMGLWVESFIPARWWNKFNAYKTYTCQHIDFSIEQTVEQPAGAALMFRNQWRLDDHYFIYGSDVDLCRTIIKSGYKIIQTPEAIVYHHQSKGGTENCNLRLYLDIDNYYGMQYYFKKHNEIRNYYTYWLVFTISLFLRALLSSILFSQDKRSRWLKVKYFLQGKNFTVRFSK